MKEINLVNVLDWSSMVVKLDSYGHTVRRLLDSNQYTSNLKNKKNKLKKNLFQAESYQFRVQ